MSTANSKTKMINFLKRFGPLPNKRFAVSTSNRTAQAMRNVGSLEEALHSNGKYDIYFYVNNGGTKAGDIDELTACFVDLDAGRDKAGKYLKPSEVAKKKKHMQQGIKAFGDKVAKPNVVVETRNGYQVYWLLTKGWDSAYIPTWNKVQAKINNWFQHYGADHRAMKVNQIMRLPGTHWCKRWEGKGESFLTSYKTKSSTRHHLTALFNKLSHMTDKIERTTTKTWKGSHDNFGKEKKSFDPERDVVKGSVEVSTDSQSLRAFLRDVAQVLYQKQMFYMSKVAWAFYNNFQD